jgi:hypothetical protein
LGRLAKQACALLTIIAAFIEKPSGLLIVGLTSGCREAMKVTRLKTRKEALCRDDAFAILGSD